MRINDEHKVIELEKTMSIFMDVMKTYKENEHIVDNYGGSSFVGAYDEKEIERYIRSKVQDKGYLNKLKERMNDTIDELIKE